MTRKKIVILLILLVIVIISVYLFFSYKKGDEITWKSSTIERGSVVMKVTATGSLNALTTVEVGAQVNGTIAKLYADFNSQVKKGQVIALLDTTFLSASKEDAQALVEKAKAQLDQAKLEYERNKKLLSETAIAQADYDLSYNNYKTMQSTLRSAQAQFNRAKINLQYATIRAPISGVVISRNVDVGQTVISSFNSPVLFVIANDLTKMQVVANVDEADIGQVKTGQEANFTVDAYPDELFSGKINQIRLQPLIVQNVVNYAVIIDVPNEDLKLMPGLTANINIIIKEDSSTLKVPVNALHFTPPEDYLKSLPDSVVTRLKKEPSSDKEAILWLKKENYLYTEKVNVKISDGNYTAISGPVNEGDEIITGVINNQEKTSGVKNPFLPSFRQASKKK